MDKQRVAFPLNSAMPVPTGAEIAAVEVELAVYSMSILVSVAEIAVELIPEIKEREKCYLGDEELLLMPCIEAEVNVVSGCLESQKTTESRNKFVARQQHALETLRKYAGLFGVRTITMHVDVPDVYAPIPVRAKDAIDILCFSSPVHSSDDKDVLRKICNFPISSNQHGYPVLFPPCPMRGGVVMEEKQAIAQYIKNTFYILFHPNTLTERGGVYESACFPQVLLDLLSLWQSGGTGRESKDVDEKPRMLAITEEGISEEFTRVENTLRAERTENIAMIEKHVRDLEAQLINYRRKLRELRFRNSRPSFYNPPFSDGNIEAVLADFARIQVHPLVRELSILSEKGIYMRTNEVIIEHESVRYRIGSFSALFRYDGLFDVWSEETFHPEGIPHPHIGIDTDVCMGNVGDAMRNALADFQFVDAIDYFLLWLSEGYTPGNVIGHPITEWPIVAAAVEVS